MSNANKLAKIAELMDKIERAQTEANELLRKLHRALALQEFCPDAFDKGACSIGVRGNVEHRPETATFIITDGDGAKRTFPLMSVPFPLWPKKALAVFASHSPARKRSLNQLGIKF